MVNSEDKRMAGRGQNFDKRLKPRPQLVPPKWNVFDYVMLSRDEKCYFPLIGRAGGEVKVSRKFLLSRRSPRVDNNVVYEELASLKPTESRSFFAVRSDKF